MSKIILKWFLINIIIGGTDRQKVKTEIIKKRRNTQKVKNVYGVGSVTLPRIQCFIPIQQKCSWSLRKL